MKKEIVLVVMTVLFLGCLEKAPTGINQNGQSTQNSVKGFEEYLKTSEESGIKTESANPSMRPCLGRLASYQVNYNNGDFLDILYDNDEPSLCSDDRYKDKAYTINYNINRTRGGSSVDRYSIVFGYTKDGNYVPLSFNGASGELRWIYDSNNGQSIIQNPNGKLDTEISDMGDVNEANTFIKVMTAKADDVIKKFNSGELKPTGITPNPESYVNPNSRQ